MSSSTLAVFVRLLHLHDRRLRHLRPGFIIFAPVDIVLFINTIMIVVVIILVNIMLVSLTLVIMAAVVIFLNSMCLFLSYSDSLSSSSAC